jgi:hypothetical protein
MVLPKASHLHLLSFRARVCHPNTRVCVGLLGPCFKTGRLKPFRQHPKLRSGTPPGSKKQNPAINMLFTEPSSEAAKVPRSRAAVLGPAQSIVRSGYNALRKGPPSTRLSTPDQTDADPQPPKMHRPQRQLSRVTQYWFQAFPF